MPTRQQVEFERSLIDVLKSQSVADAICDALIKTISNKFSERFNYFDAKIKSLEAEIELLKSTKNNANDNVKNIITSEDQTRLEQKMDNLEQHAKRNNIRLMGLSETKNNNNNILDTVKDLFVNKLKVNSTSIENELLVAYRVGQQSETNDKPRHIIVTFSNTSTKNLIYTKKRMLKGTGLVIKEDLTVKRLAIVKDAAEKYGFKNVWTFNGIVFAKTEKGVEKMF